MMTFQDGQTALHQAASAGHGETVAALILGGCDVSLQDFVSFYHHHRYHPCHRRHHHHQNHRHVMP